LGYLDFGDGKVPKANGSTEEKNIGAYEVMKHGPGVVSQDWKDRMAKSSNPHRNADAWKMLGAQQKTTIEQQAKEDKKREDAAEKEKTDAFKRLAELKEERMNGGLDDEKKVCMTRLFNKMSSISMTDDLVSLRWS
jgi:hypothetical protein